MSASHGQEGCPGAQQPSAALPRTSPQLLSGEVCVGEKGKTRGKQLTPEVPFELWEGSGCLLPTVPIKEGLLPPRPQKGMGVQLPPGG